MRIAAVKGNHLVSNDISALAGNFLRTFYAIETLALFHSLDSKRWKYQISRQLICLGSKHDSK